MSHCGFIDPWEEAHQEALRDASGDDEGREGDGQDGLTRDGEVLQLEVSKLDDEIGDMKDAVHNVSGLVKETLLKRLHQYVDKKTQLEAMM